MLTKLMKGQSGNPISTLAGEIVTKRHKTYHASLPKGAGFELTWKFDFTGVSRETLMKWATEHLCIAMRPKFKAFGYDDDGRFVATPETMAEWDGITWKAQDIASKQARTPRMSFAAKATKFIANGVKTFTKREKAAYALNIELIDQAQYDAMIAEIELDEAEMTIRDTVGAAFADAKDKAEKQE